MTWALKLEDGLRVAMATGQTPNISGNRIAGDLVGGRPEVRLLHQLRHQDMENSGREWNRDCVLVTKEGWVSEVPLSPAPTDPGGMGKSNVHSSTSARDGYMALGCP